LRVEIQLVDIVLKALGAVGANAITSANVAFAISNVEYVANNIELSDHGHCYWRIAGTAFAVCNSTISQLWMGKSKYPSKYKHHAIEHAYPGKIHQSEIHFYMSQRQENWC
jgi:hypothetical protein